MKHVEWLSKNPPKKRASKLEAHRETIMDLINQGYTQNQVVTYLRSVCNIKTTQPNVHKFLAKKVQVLNTNKVMNAQQKEEPKGKVNLDEHFKSLI